MSPRMARRGLLSGATAAAALVTLPAAQAAILARAGADAELIGLCDQLCAIEKRRAPLFNAKTLEEERARQPAMDLLEGEWDEVWEAMRELSPTTMAGAVAAARATLAIACRRAETRPPAGRSWRQSVPVFLLNEGTEEGTIRSCGCRPLICCGVGPRASPPTAHQCSVRIVHRGARGGTSPPRCGCWAFWKAHPSP
jgi:hypothetical protein